MPRAWRRSPRAARGLRCRATRSCCRSRSEPQPAWCPASRFTASTISPARFIQIQRAAFAPDGLFIAGAGPRRPLSSVQELRQVLIEAEAELQGGASARVAPFADASGVWRCFAARRLRASCRRLRARRVTYPGPRELMREIRALGGGNVMAARRKAPAAARHCRARRRDLTGPATARLTAGSRRKLRDRLSDGLGPARKPAKPL